MAVLIALTSVSVIVQAVINRSRLAFSKKAWLFFNHAFFIACSLAFPVQQASAYCELNTHQLAALEPVKVDKVIDGDSVIFADGREVRLVGVNAPEFGRSAQYGAEAAKNTLSGLVSGKTLYWASGVQEKDRYGRFLGHLFLSNGRNIEAALLEQGMGFLVVIPPNHMFAECQAKARDAAKSAKLGVWAKGAYETVEVALIENGGFQWIQGKLLSISVSKGAWWLQLEGPVVLKIAQKHQYVFQLEALKRLVGQSITVSGWVVDRAKNKAVSNGYSRYMLLLTHPRHLEYER